MPRAPAPVAGAALLMLLLLLLCRPAEAVVETGRRQQPPKSDRMILKVEMPDAAAAGQDIAAAAGLSYVTDLGDGFVVLAAEGEPSRASTARLAIRAAANKSKAGQPPATPLGEAVARGRVSSVEEDFIVLPQAMAPECTIDGCPSLWGMGAIRAPRAWALVKESDVAPTTVTVRGGVIDTGIMYNHVELDTQVLNTLGRSYRMGSIAGDGSDDQGHGTHVTGTMAAEWNKATTTGGIAGVNGAAAVASCKFLWSKGGYTSDAVLCADYLISINAHHVINNSWGGGGASSALLAAIQRVCNAGGLFIVAAGNDGVDIATGAYPALYVRSAPCVIPVAATDANNNTLAAWSNFGPDVLLGAPGVDVRSSVWSRKSNSAQAVWSGTSMATPHVSSVALLLRNQYGLTGAQVKDILLSSASRGAVNSYAGRTIADMRLLNAEEAVKMAMAMAKGRR